MKMLLKSELMISIVKNWMAAKRLERGETELRKIANDTFDKYDYVLIGFSGGKDSIACVLFLKDILSPENWAKLELWHHLVDGMEGSELMDWKCTEDYCRQFGKAIDAPVYMSWLEGGFEREMLRDNQKKAATWWECPNGDVGTGGGIRGKETTRRKFPQVSPDLSVRWCSAYLKIDVMSMAINGQPRFKGKNTLVITGERAEESPGRAKYPIYENHRTNSSKKHVDHFRPVHGWSEKQVWDILKKYKINPHPAYKLGWGRLSCAACIFGNGDQFASLRKCNKAQFEKVASYEEQFGLTIKRKKTIRQIADEGTVYSGITESNRRQALGLDLLEPIIIEGEWMQPDGAFGESCGPV